ncbi:MAG: hypothetical protein CMH53_06965 [Myxococcales bacterium]|jgi:hypothetical protein|nr:hypothetical protein [Myxococcales bacterium]
MLRVLVACEFSGTVRDAFIRRGHDAVSVDLLPSESDFGPHIQGDALEHLDRDRFDMLIAHPPCTFLANSGVRWLYSSPGERDEKRWSRMREAAAFFRKFLDCEIPLICVENPVMHGHAAKLIGQRQTQSVQPWQFGDGEVKRTCLWLDGLPPLLPTDVVEGREARVWRMPPGPERQKERSRFFVGMATAMAAQWGEVWRDGL